MNSERKGPWEVFPFGKYRGRKVLDVMDEDIQYVGFVVKQFLDLSPSQAEYFYLKSDVEVPEEYIKHVKETHTIKENTAKLEILDKPPYGFPSMKEYYDYVNNRDIQPNYNFDNEKD